MYFVVLSLVWCISLCVESFCVSGTHHSAVLILSMACAHAPRSLRDLEEHAEIDRGKYDPLFIASTCAMAAAAHDVAAGAQALRVDLRPPGALAGVVRAAPSVQGPGGVPEAPGRGGPAQEPAQEARGEQRGQGPARPRRGRGGEVTRPPLRPILSLLCLCARGVGGGRCAQPRVGRSRRGALRGDCTWYFD